MKWEYKMVWIDSDDLKGRKVEEKPLHPAMNELGAQGWELAATLELPTEAWGVLMIFKRSGN
jgi:hypothetical protein